MFAEPLIEAQLLRRLAAADPDSGILHLPGQIVRGLRPGGEMTDAVTPQFKIFDRFFYVHPWIPPGF